MKLSLGFSPCPNDTFIFDALVNKKIDTGGIDFEVSLEDVETLNQWALEGRLDITKLSFPAFFLSMETYVLLNAGAALGKGVGPLLISAKNQSYDDNQVLNSSIALPGEHTTANLLFNFAYPGATRKSFMLFSGIEQAVLQGEAELGVIIHENRFTYQQKGLFKVRDLGEYWESKMNVPVPLGAIAIDQGIKRTLALEVENLIRKSISYGFEHYSVIPEYVKTHSAAMDEEIMKKHIELYVNNYSLDLGSEGKKAIRILYDTFLKTTGQPEIETTLFL